MRKVLFTLGAAVAGLALFSLACGGGDDDDAKTQAPTNTAAGTKTAAATATKASTASAEELAAHLAKIKSVMLETKEKAEAGDVQGTQDAEGKGDDAIEALIDALKAADSPLGDQLEALELDYEGQADSDNPDLTVIAKDAQDVLDLLDQVAAALEIEAPSNSADLSADLATLKTVMEDTKAKAEAGDVAGTQEAEGKGDDAIEALIDALKTADPSLADQLETLELDYEGQADSDNPDLTVIAKDTQDVLDLLDEIAAALDITS